MAEKGDMTKGRLGGVVRLREEHEKAVKDCKGRMQHWEKLTSDYEVLRDRLKTLPDQLSYDIMVPFGPLAFMPGKLVHTNEVTVLLGDNWFAKCSAKQAEKIVDHRIAYVKGELDELSKTARNFQARAGFAKDLEVMAGYNGDYTDIREEVRDDGGDDVMWEVAAANSKGKRRIAHKPKSKPKADVGWDAKDEVEDGGLGAMTEKELWARLDELERLEELQDQQDRLLDCADTNGQEVAFSSSSSEEDKDGDSSPTVNGLSQEPGWPPATTDLVPPPTERTEEDNDDENGEGDGGSCLPSIFFSHTVELKKVRINTGKNTTLKYSERKEQKEHSKRRKKNGHCNGHSHHEHHRISTPADIYRLFVDKRNGEPVPRKSILKSRSRENSVCSDTSESSAAEFEERRAFGRGLNLEEVAHSDSDGIAEEEDSPAAAAQSPPIARFEAFSGTVVEKDPMPSAVPHLVITPPALPTILERRQEEVAPDATAAIAPPPPPPTNQQQQPPKRVSKFKAARLQQK